MEVRWIRCVQSSRENFEYRSFAGLDGNGFFKPQADTLVGHNIVRSCRACSWR